MKKNILLLSIVLFATFLSGCGRADKAAVLYGDSLPPLHDGYVGLQDGHFVLDGEPWRPLMLNYKAFIKDGVVMPASWYKGGDIRDHFDTIAAWGFNAVRVCLDVLDNNGDSTAMFKATRRMVRQADSAGLRVMLLIKPPLDDYWAAYTKGLLRALADLPALWAYDFMNEPLYFDPEPERDKQDAVRLVARWRHWVRTLAPYQLFTVATAEPIEVFEWDPSMLPVDFIEMHTYHPLRVFSEMWWYSHYCGKPWMVGETALPADNDSVPYAWQAQYAAESYMWSKHLGAIGFGWWEFADYPQGVNFEAQYTGLRDTLGQVKPALAALMTVAHSDVNEQKIEAFALRVTRPVNYFNMLAYGNICLSGRVVDKKSGAPVEGAVVRGWNDDWSVGMNTYTDASGRFTLYSNDYNVHFEVSAPGMSREKFDRHNLRYDNLSGVNANNLPDRKREYQQIDYRPYLNRSTPGCPFNVDYDSAHFFRYSLSGDMGTVKLTPLKCAF